MNDYEKQAEQFLTDTGTKFTIEYLRTGPYFAGDKESRDIYRFTLSNARGSYSHEFGASLRDTADRRAAKFGIGRAFPNEREWAAHAASVKRYKEKPMPSAYDVLAGLGHYTEPLFSDWAAELGYDTAPMTDYPKLREIHEDCLRESAALSRMFTPEQLEQLREVQ